jgi:protein tyrosine phosphatase (PTP) superfamily phosphohydrolase (DUF442 family)
LLRRANGSEEEHGRGAARRRRGFAPAVLIAAIVLSAGSFQTAPPDPSRSAAWAQRVPSQYLKNWHTLGGDVYRSEQPGRKGFIEIRDRGIKTVLNLRSRHKDDAKAEGLGLILVRVPMTAGGFSEADLVAALKAIRNAAKPVLIHCRHGADRSGVVSAMYRVVFQGWSKKEAIAELRDGGFRFHRRYKNIPAFIREADVDKIKRELGLAARDSAQPGMFDEDRPSRLPGLCSLPRSSRPARRP